jgi:hypothetical protein
MNAFRRYLLALVILLVLTSVYVTVRFNLDYPKPLGPALDDRIHQRYVDGLRKSKADIVLIGDSILARGINSDQLEQLTGKKNYKLGIQGSASAAWYLALKNVVLAAKYRPSFVVIIFRGTMLTAPGYRVSGAYFREIIDELATPNDTLLLERGFVQEMSPVEQWADQYLPLYGYRLNWRTKIEFYIRYTLTSLFGCDVNCNYKANIVVFDQNHLDKILLVEAVAGAESQLYIPERLNFEKEVDRSFLPEIVRLAHENNIQLILVNSKRWDGPTEAPESPEYKKYFQSLKNYVEKNGVIMLDFAHDERLTKDLYYDDMHTNESGAILFTNIFAKALLPILNK